jgi:hypothetical protein
MANNEALRVAVVIANDTISVDKDGNLKELRGAFDGT